MDFGHIDKRKPFLQFQTDIEVWKEDQRKKDIEDLNAGVTTVDQLFRKSCAISPESAKAAQIRFW